MYFCLACTREPAEHVVVTSHGILLICETCKVKTDARLWQESETDYLERMYAKPASEVGR